MIGLLIVAVVCTLGLAVEVTRLVVSYGREDKRETSLRRETFRCHELLERARELQYLAPSKETRLLVTLGEAWCDLMAAVHAEDWETAAAFENQIETIEALLVNVETGFKAERMEPFHRELVEAARWN